MVSPTYKQFAQAMAAKKQIVCEYDGYARELCAVILGHTGGQEKALTFQLGGQSKSGMPPNGEWRCLFLEKVRNLRLRDGPWRGGDRHTQPQGCVSRCQSNESVQSKTPAVGAFLADRNVGNPFSDATPLKGGALTRCEHARHGERRAREIVKERIWLTEPAPPPAEKLCRAADENAERWQRRRIRRQRSGGGVFTNAAERRAEHLAAAPAIALMVNEGNHREARAGGGVGDRRPATIGVPAQDLGFVTQTQASYGVDARGDLHAARRHLKDVRSARGVEHVPPLEQARECLSDTEAGGRGGSAMPPIGAWVEPTSPARSGRPDDNLHETTGGASRPGMDFPGFALLNSGCACYMQARILVLSCWKGAPDLSA
jgi:hypothetical protein